MKKIMKQAVVVMMLICMCTALFGCASTSSDSDEVKDVMFVVTGTLGSGTNNDSVYEALVEYTDRVEGTVSTFECNMDTSLYESTLMQAAETGEYDLIVTGFGTMVEPLTNTAAAYPDQKFIIFDTEMDYTDGINSNVSSVQVLQNEGGFLAGVLAASITTSDATLANEDKIVGFVGAQETTAIQDFLMGYIEGVKFVDSEIEVVYSFVGNATDTALAKELALVQYQSGADVVFACGGNGMGVAEAALDTDAYVIGVDYDYAAVLEETSVEAAEKVLTSVVKDYKGMITPMLDEIEAGTFEWGTHSYINYENGGVYLVEDGYTTDIVTADVWDVYDAAKAALVDGEVSVSTAYGATVEEIEAVFELAGSY